MCEVSKMGMRMVQHTRRAARRNGAVVRLRAKADAQRIRGRMDARSTQGDERSREEMMAKVFPVALIALDVAAAVVYAACGDWRRFVYWLAAATLTATVTF